MKRVTALMFGAFLMSCTFFATADERETVAVVGTGDMGDSLGPRFAELGYRVVFGSRTPDSDRVKALVEMTGHGASATTAKEAAQQGSIVLTLVGWPAMETVAQNLGDLELVADNDDLAEFPKTREPTPECAE